MIYQYVNKERVERKIILLVKDINKTLDRASLFKKENDWKNYGYQMYKVGKKSGELEQVALKYDIKLNNKLISKIGKRNTFKELPIFISKRTTSEFPEL